MRSIGVVRRFVIAVAGVVLGASVQAGTISLAWNPVPGAAGYRVHYGTSPGQYDEFRDVGNTTATVLEGLRDCTVYYLALKAYNQGMESDGFSQEITGLARPEITSLDPSQAAQGDQLTLDVVGANFEQGAALTWNQEEMPVDVDGNPLLRLDSVSVQSCNRIQALLTIEPQARGFRAMQIGAQSLWFEVINPDTVFNVMARNLEVTFAPTRADINRSDSATRDRVDGKDLGWLAYAYGSAEGAPEFNPDADLNGDGLIDGDDLALLSPVFGMCWDGSDWSTDACP